jgi:hypothetical protein
MGLARSFPGLDFPAGDFRLDSFVHERIPAFAKMKAEGKTSKHH